jgi:hypothetical protein
MKALWAIVVVSLVAGCGGRVERPPTTPVTSIPAQGGWFCEPHPSGEGWLCVRDPDRVADPRRDRRPAVSDSSGESQPD